MKIYPPSKAFEEALYPIEREYGKEQADLIGELYDEDELDEFHDDYAMFVAFNHLSK